MNSRRYGFWESVNFCVECDAILGMLDEMYSDAACPYCGHASGGTVCDTRPGARRKVYTGPWWKFWQWEWEYK
jgi:predicted RNA-binding Zn-ribbon protein involved in translation (DUF1610 family)